MPKEKMTCAFVHFPEKYFFSQNSFQGEIILDKNCFKIRSWTYIDIFVFPCARSQGAGFDVDPYCLYDQKEKHYKVIEVNTTRGRKYKIQMGYNQQEEKKLKKKKAGHFFIGLFCFIK